MACFCLLTKHCSRSKPAWWEEWVEHHVRDRTSYSLAALFSIDWRDTLNFDLFSALYGSCSLSDLSAYVSSRLVQTLSSMSNSFAFCFLMVNFTRFLKWNSGMPCDFKGVFASTIASRPCWLIYRELAHSSNMWQSEKATYLIRTFNIQFFRQYFWYFIDALYSLHICVVGDT